MAKVITSGNSHGPASQPSTIDDVGNIRGAANGITLSSGAVPVEARGVVLANNAPAAIVPYARLKTAADLSSAKLLTLLATSIALVSPPALSQGAAGPGGPAAAPQPQVVVPTPQAPQAPRAPAPMPTPPAVAPMGGAPQAKSSATVGGSVKDAGKAAITPINGDIIIDDPSTDLSKGPGAGGRQQERSRASLPAGYGYDATGRIVYTGR